MRGGLGGFDGTSGVDYVRRGGEEVCVGGRARGARETRGDGGSRVQGEQGGAVVRTQRYSINERTQCQSQISTPGHIQGFGIKHLPCFFNTNGAKVIADDPARFSMQMTARWTAETALQTPRT